MSPPSQRGRFGRHRASKPAVTVSSVTFAPMERVVDLAQIEAFEQEAKDNYLREFMSQPMPLSAEATVAMNDLRLEWIRREKDVVVFKKFSEQIDRLNQLIDAYNQTPTREAKIQLLQEIKQQQQMSCNGCLIKDMNRSQVYREAIQINLFKAIQQQFHELGLVVPRHTLPELLENMAPEKASKLLEILSQGERYDAARLDICIGNLYGGVSSEEQEAFDRFFREHTIEFLGGVNSKNYKITPLDGSQPMVLQAEYRFGEAEYAGHLLRNGPLHDVMTPAMGERMTTCTDASGKLMSRVLMVTDFCQRGNLFACIQGCHNEEDRLRSTLQWYQQMGAILVRIQNSGCAFTDIKNENWLVDDKGELHIADSKSLIFSEGSGVLYANKTSMVYTSWIGIPERVAGAEISVDKMHAYALGKVIYQSITQCDRRSLNKVDASEFDFSADVFKTEVGMRLKQLIQNTVKRDPNDRLSVAEVVSQLAEIEQVLMSSHAVSQRYREEMSVIRQAEIGVAEEESLSPASAPK